VRYEAGGYVQPARLEAHVATPVYKRVNLGDAARAAAQMARVVERVRVKHLARVEQETNDARRRLYPQ
jgi:hypothetical protein